MYLRAEGGDHSRDRAHGTVVHVGEIGDAALDQATKGRLRPEQRMIADVEPEHLLLALSLDALSNSISGTGTLESKAGAPESSTATSKRLKVPWSRSRLRLTAPSTT